MYKKDPTLISRIFDISQEAKVSDVIFGDDISNIQSDYC